MDKKPWIKPPKIIRNQFKIPSIREKKMYFVLKIFINIYYKQPFVVLEIIKANFPIAWKWYPIIQKTSNSTRSDKNNIMFSNDNYTYGMTSFTGKIVLHIQGGERWEIKVSLCFTWTFYYQDHLSDIQNHLEKSIPNVLTHALKSTNHY